MSQLDIPGRPPANPLLVLASSMEGVIEELRGLRSDLKPPFPHVYALEETPAPNSGQFLVYCWACSEAEQRYVHPCLHQAEGVTPPPTGFRVDPAETATGGA